MTPHPAVEAIAWLAPGWSFRVDHVAGEVRARRGDVAVFAPLPGKSQDWDGCAATLLARIRAQEAR